MDTKTKTEILNAYQRGRNSIQDIARIFKVSVPEVLDLIGEGQSKSVSVPGDLISEAEAGPDATMNFGKEVKVPFSVD